MCGRYSLAVDLEDIQQRFEFIFGEPAYSPRNLARKPTFSRSSIFGRRISMVWRLPCRIPSETMPYKTGIRLSRVARNLAKGFPARLLGTTSRLRSRFWQ